jgi:hypothetical protein
MQGHGSQWGPLAPVDTLPGTGHGGRNWHEPAPAGWEQAQQAALDASRRRWEERRR